MTIEIIRLGHRCLRCEHEWIPNDINRKPRVCPECKSPYWDTARRTRAGESAYPPVSDSVAGNLVDTSTAASPSRDDPESGAAASAGVRNEFRALADWWHDATDSSSSPRLKHEHPAYRRVVEMGQPAVRHILEDLQRRGGHWFSALAEITKTQPPLPAGTLPSVRAEREAWLAWGKGQGILG